MTCFRFETRDPNNNNNVGDIHSTRNALPDRCAYACCVELNAKNWVTRVAAILAAIAIGTTAAVAQPKIQDRHPAMIEADRPLTFEERWEPVRRMMLEQSFRHAAPRLRLGEAPTTAATTPLPAPPGSVEPIREKPVRVVRLVQIGGGPAQATCLRHNMRTVYRGASWRCRR